MMRDHQDFIQQLADCAAACEYCADQCLNEDNIPKMVPCIRLDRDCADTCHRAIGFVARQSQHARQAVELCRNLCKQCGDECARHETDHCQACAQACRACEEACRRYLQTAA